MSWHQIAQALCDNNQIKDKGNAMCKGSTPIHFRAGFLLLICSQSQGDAPQDTYKSGIVLLMISTLLWLIEGSYGSLNRFFTAINMQIFKKKNTTTFRIKYEAIISSYSKQQMQ